MGDSVSLDSTRLDSTETFRAREREATPEKRASCKERSDILHGSCVSPVSRLYHRSAHASQCVDTLSLFLTREASAPMRPPLPPRLSRAVPIRSRVSGSLRHPTRSTPRALSDRHAPYPLSAPVRPLARSRAILLSEIRKITYARARETAITRSMERTRARSGFCANRGNCAR